MGHADFRTGGRIFATLDAQETKGTVLVSPDEQAMLVATEPSMFAPVKGGWGKQGATEINFAQADDASMRSALTMAWRRRAKPADLAALTSPASPPPVRGRKAASSRARPSKSRGTKKRP